MAEYIEREALIKRLKFLAKHEDPFRQSVILGVAHTVGCEPAADVVEVVHGYWVERKYKVLWGDGEYSLFHCSECDTPAAREEKFCRNCGARMDGEG